MRSWCVDFAHRLTTKGLEWLEECWQTKRKEAARTPKTLTMWEMNMFGVPWDVTGTLLPEEVMERYMSWQLKVNVVKQVFSSADQIDTEIGDADVFARCRELNSIMYHTMLHVAHFCSVAQPEPYMTPWDGEAETLNQVMRFHKSTEKMKSVQLALFRILGSQSTCSRRMTFKVHSAMELPTHRRNGGAAKVHGPRSRDWNEVTMLHCFVYVKGTDRDSNM